jgi:hypothetical protein
MATISHEALPEAKHDSPGHEFYHDRIARQTLEIPCVRQERRENGVRHLMARTDRSFVRRFAVALCTFFVFGGMAAPAIAQPTLEQLMADFGFSKDDLQRVYNGEMVKTTTQETSDREIAAVIVFLIKAPTKELIGSFEVGTFFHDDPQVQASVEIRGDGTLDDFKSLVLQPGGAKETQRYLDAAPGTTLNLSNSEIAGFQALRESGTATQAQVEQAIRQMLLTRYQTYRSQGLAGIAPYARGDGQETQPANALRSATEVSRAKKYVPPFYAVLKNYPKERPPELIERFFWIRYAMDGRPNFTLRHRMAMPIADGYVIADREYYVGFDYNETQAIAAMLPVKEGTAAFYVNRTTTDQLGGFAASAKQAIGRSVLAKQLGDIFQKLRAGYDTR